MSILNDEKASAEMRKIKFNPEKIKLVEKSLQLRAGWQYQQQTAIAEIAKFTGGWTEYLEQPEQAGKIYSEILAGMNRRYVIGYYPTNQARDGKLRQVKIEVRRRPDYKIWGRTTYSLQ